MRGANLFDRSYTTHSFRVGGALSQQLVGAPVDAIMRLFGWKTRSVAERCTGAIMSQGNPEAKRVKTQRGHTVAYDRQHTELTYDQANRLPRTPEFQKDFADFRSTRTSAVSNKTFWKEYHEANVEHTLPQKQNAAIRLRRHGEVRVEQNQPWLGGLILFQSTRTSIKTGGEAIPRVNFGQKWWN